MDDIKNMVPLEWLIILFGFGVAAPALLLTAAALAPYWRVISAVGVVVGGSGLTWSLARAVSEWQKSDG
mgnify:CR=1 FL=1